MSTFEWDDTTTYGTMEYFIPIYQWKAIWRKTNSMSVFSGKYGLLIGKKRQLFWRHLVFPIFA
jgi:hypothetical protein